MACQSCQSQTRSLLRSARRAGVTAPAAASLWPSITPAAAVTQQVSMQNTTRIAARHLSTSSKRQFFGRVKESYRVLAASEMLFKVCSKPADYKITIEVRKKGHVRRRDDGEELGKSTCPENVWHNVLGMQPSFNTWSHVTMVHLYILHARLRCFGQEEYRNWSQQMIDHFFFECERKMHIDHNITSSAMRQRYLKDVFVQWRGLLLSFDEGLVKGDAVLASAIWRNLFKGDPEVDPRSLVAVVGWMRSGLVALEAAKDEVMPTIAMEVLQRPVDVFWLRLEKPFLSDQTQHVQYSRSASVPDLSNGWLNPRPKEDDEKLDETEEAAPPKAVSPVEEEERERLCAPETVGKNM